MLSVVLRDVAAQPRQRKKTFIGSKVEAGFVGVQPRISTHHCPRRFQPRVLLGTGDVEGPNCAPRSTRGTMTRLSRGPREPFL